MESGPDTLIKFLESLPPWMEGTLMAIFIAVLRVVYDREETNAVRIVLEGLLCGALTLSAGSAIALLGFSDSWYLFVGGVIGFIGSHSIRRLAVNYLSKKTS